MAIAETDRRNMAAEQEAQEVFLDREQVRSRKGYAFLRRAQDLLFSFLAILVLAVPMGLVALIIVLDSPGDSPIFRQKRVGLDGREFYLYKFRSMIPNAETHLDALLSQNEMDGPVFKIKGDPRITRVGRILRKTGIDELPQLINILKGEMSIVGPRPALPREVEQYGDYERQRMYIKPGLTCFWQIQPRRNDLSFAQWMALDMAYIQERSFWVDWVIIFRTFKAVLKGEGE